MELSRLIVNTVLLRPYVFFFLAVSLMSASRVLGWPRTSVLFGVTWIIAFLCEWSSTRIGIPFGDYFYTGTTVGEELYLSNVPFMDSLSFTFLLYASYCLALLFCLHWTNHTSFQPFDLGTMVSWPVIGLTALFFMLIDVVIDPVALRGDRWFLGQIYGYPEPGLYFGVPLANFGGWLIVGLLSMSIYRLLGSTPWLVARTSPVVRRNDVLLGCGLYYGILAFNLFMTFWIGEPLLGVVGCLLYLPLTALAVLKLGRVI
ncbi:MAG: carotenoid biosynthesis protein [Nitrospirae bacterium]|nr:MAG: carotenoid biosynthesis protein [Nitrospirota bacterium]